MNEELLAKAKEELDAAVIRFIEKQRGYMIESPNDFKESTPDDFVVWFFEWGMED